MPDQRTTDPAGAREPAARPLLRTVLGRVLRRTRREQGRTLAEVAHAARVSLAYLSELERGRKEASSEVLAAICAALAVDLSDLLTEVGRGLAADPAGARRGTVVQLAEFRGGRQVPAPRRRDHLPKARIPTARIPTARIPTARRSPGAAGEVVLLRAA